MQTRIAPLKKSALYSFGSLAELGRYLDDTPRTWKGSDSSVTTYAEPHWDLGAGYKACVTYAREGWLEGAQRAQHALKAFTPATPKPDRVNDFYGYAPNVPRYCAGAPDCMMRKTPDPHEGMGRVLTLIVPVNALGYVSGKYMANFGLAVAQYVNQLEMEGVRVELIGAICSIVSGWRVVHTFQIKTAEQGLDLAVVAFAIGHPGMFRRLGFALRERCAAPRDHGYGRSDSLRMRDVINAPPGAIILNGMVNADTCARTPQEALEYITAQIDKAIADNEASA